MTERRTEVSKEYQRAVSRTEIYRERLDNYRRNASSYFGTWDEVVDAQKVRAKSALAFPRLNRQLQEYAKSVPDRSGELSSLQTAVVMLTKQDDVYGLEGLEWAYDAIIGEFRSVKGYETERLRRNSGFNNLQVEAERIRRSNKLFINVESQQAVVGDKLVTFEEPRDWEVFLHLARYRNRNILPREIEKLARENGAIDANPSANSIRRLRKLIEEDFTKPEIITLNNPGRYATYKFNVSDIRFYYPSRNSVENKTQEVQEKVLSLDSFRSESRRRQELERRDPELSERINGIVQEVNNATSMITGKLVTLFQISHAFPNVKNEFIAEMQEKYINPQRRVGDKHPGFEKYEVAFMVYFRRFGSRLNLNPVLVKELVQMIKSAFEQDDQTKIG